MPKSSNFELRSEFCNSLISLYFHIPFCTRKCDYCHFYVIPDKEHFKDQFLTGLMKEWELKKAQIQDKTISTIYFGGGTPALVGPEAIQTILGWISSEASEITLEINPENVTTESIRRFKSVGINRISMGVQALDQTLLMNLSRQHSAKQAIDAVICIAEAGITNISIDLMYDLPGQTFEHWKKTVDAACQLPITHLSLYNLTIEPHTVFYKKRHALEKQIPDSEISLQMYQYAVETFNAAGLEQYEISAFARKGYQSKHNKGYWEGRPFLGFGPSAFSYWEGKRFRNVANLNRYSMALEHQKSTIDFEEELTTEAKKRELLTIRLRMMSGVDIQKFENENGKLEDVTMAMLHKLCREDLLAQRNGIFSLTKRGTLLYDTIATELI